MEQPDRLLSRILTGQVSERLKERHWKCRVRLVRTVGSNPTLSALLRGVAQLGSASDWGSEGRRFKSCHPDYKRLACAGLL